MGKQRQRKKTPKRRTNPIQRKRGVEQGIKEGSTLPIPTTEQVAPVVERVSRSKLCKVATFF
jgi:hypothetical protein